MLNNFDKLILSATFISFVLSVYLYFTGQELLGVFVGIWVPSIIGVGIYLKLIRLRHFLPSKLTKKGEDYHFRK